MDAIQWQHYISKEWARSPAATAVKTQRTLKSLAALGPGDEHSGWPAPTPGNSRLPQEFSPTSTQPWTSTAGTMTAWTRTVYPSCVAPPPSVVDRRLERLSSSGAVGGDSAPRPFVARTWSGPTAVTLDFGPRLADRSRSSGTLRVGRPDLGSNATWATGPMRSAKVDSSSVSSGSSTRGGSFVSEAASGRRTPMS
mmetsp:Transcript_105921/g.297832  ORF Transcript_105921/g.297832 Transcript_105921/m.297832 type:complete len:196 (-) Transcript_105921:129-716(-)